MKGRKKNKSKLYSAWQGLKKMQDDKKIKDYNHVVKWGKWKGRTIQEILFENPQYLKWCADENIIEFSNEIYEEIIYQCELKEDDNG